MSEREYIVSLNEGVDYAGFNAEMVTNTGAGDIPSRSVAVENPRELSLRNTHYNLTDAEAEALKSDSRVYDVALLPDLDPNIGTGFDATQTGDFSKTLLDRGSFLNWGMRRVNEATTPYTGSTAAAGGYNYTLDGTGVDVVIMDSGIQADHPEFQDASGVTRVQQIDWYTASGVAGTMPGTFYTDEDGHGTHVAGTATGKTYGWAKNAKIYPMHINLGTDTTGVSISTAMDLMLGWHNNKPVDSTTGYKRPTIINMSWGYLVGYNSVSSMVYRGASKAGTDIDTGSKRWAFGLVPASGYSSSTYRTNVRVSSTDLDVQALIAAGCHVCIAAGNRSHKIDVAAGLDYNNVAVTNAGSIYYNRGSSPSDPNAFIVGNIDSQVSSSGIDQKALSSETGPAVNVYAPGTDIMSAMSTTNAFSATASNNPYPGNSAFLINNITGTSMASPQVAGMLALWLQLNPSATPAQALAFVNSTAKTAQISDTASTVDYSDRRSLLGSPNRYLFNKFNSSVQLRIGSAEVVTTYAAATYTLSTSTAAANEGQTFTITLTTTNVANATNIPYTITGVTTADISGTSLTGSFTVSSNTASTSFTLAEDNLTEGSETFLLSLNGVSESQAVTINDTSLTATYTLAGSAANVNEGSNLTITLTTVNIADATDVPYTITGVTSADIDGTSLTGNFTIISNSASLVLPITADTTTEGAETLVLTLDSGATAVSTTINDTSITPGSPTYAVTPASGSVNEGSALVFNVTTANVADATTLYWSITNAADFSTSTGSFAITSNAGTFSVTPSADSATEGAETFAASVRTGSTGGTVVATSSTVTINDTSTAGASYALAASAETVEEGESTTITLTTANVSDATNVPYTISGLSQADLDEGPLTSTAIKDYEGPGGALFARELTTNYLRIVAAGAVGGQTAVPDDWLLKTGRMAQLFLNRTGSNIVTANQDQVRANLKGATTSWHANSQAIQRVARGGGASYTPSFLTDDGSSAWGLYQLYTNHSADDMVWYLNSSSTRPQIGDDDAAEVMEHILHTLCMKGLDNPSMKFDASAESGWATGPTFLAIQQAVNGSKFDPSGYAANWATQADHFTVAAKEYLYLLTFGMFEYTSLWDGGSLAPEWTNDMRNPSDIQTNNALGYALFNTYMKPVFDNPSLATIRAIFQNGDSGDPTAAGANGYVTSTAISLTGNFTVASNTSAVTLNVAADGVTDVDSLSLALDNAAATQAITVQDNGVTPGFNPDYALYVTNSGSSSYTVVGRDRSGAISGSQSALAFNSGDKVLFTVNSATSSGHPFWVKTALTTGTGNLATPVAGNGTVNVEWTIGSTGTYYYICQYHAGMNNTITVS